MKKLLGHHMVLVIGIHLILWRIYLEIMQRIGSLLLVKRHQFAGPSPWANFDSIHYLGIARDGYGEFEQAFFPVYPFLIRHFGDTFHLSYTVAGLLISHLCLFGMLVFLWKLIPFIPSVPKSRIQEIRFWTILFVLYFPTSFYFGSVFTESLFMLLVIASFYFLLQKRYVLYGLGAAIASGVRLIGAFLMVPVGLVAYMYYLFRQTGDPLLFMHVQPAFGANRSGNELVILPQVFWRYANILIKVPITHYDWWIAFLEFVMFNGAAFLLWMAWRRKFPKWWIYFSAAAISIPTLTGTLSSMPRYVLSAFPIFIILALQGQQIRMTLFIIFVILSAILIMLFTQGYWVA